MKLIYSFIILNIGESNATLTSINKIIIIIIIIIKVPL